MALDGSATAADIAFKVGPANVSIGRIEAFGTPMSGEDIKSIFDGKSGATPAARLALVSAEAISIPLVTVILDGPERVKFLIEGIAVANAGDGRLGAVSIARIGMEMPGGRIQAGLRIGLVSSANLDLAAVLHFCCEARLDEGEARKMLFDSFDIGEIEASDGHGTSFSLGAFAAKAVEARTLTSVALFLGVLGLAGQDRKWTGGAMFADASRALTIGAVEFRDIALLNAARPNEHYRLARAALAGLREGSFDEIAFAGLDGDSGDAKIKFGALAFRGLDLRPLAVLADQMAAGGGVAMRLAIPPLAHAELAEADFDVKDTKGSGGNIARGTRDRFSVARASYDASGHIAGVPTAARASIEHIVADFPSIGDDASLKGLLAAGYSHIDFSASADVAWNEAARELALKSLRLQSAGMGSVDASLTASNVGRDLFALEPARAMAALMASALAKGEVSLANEGLFEKTMAYGAASARKTPEEFKAMIAGAMASNLAAAFGDSQGGKAVAAAMARFLAKPGKLTISATAPGGIGVAELEGFRKLAELMARLQIEAGVE